jgi:thiol-disulfide isomerase/thioredoxin
MNPPHLSDKFATALPYDRYVATGTDEQQRRWKAFSERVRLTDAQRELVAGFVREMKVLVISGIWCGDCVQQCPLLEHVARENRGKIDLRFLDRDQNRDLTERFRINGGDRVPVALFMAEDFELCSAHGDRTLRRYRALARKQLGAACPTGIGGPDPDEVAATLQDWVDEFERVQLMLRLSARLRQKHGA